MNNMPSNPENPGSPGKLPGISGTIFLVLFAMPFAGAGLFALVQGIKKFNAGEKDGAGLCLVGLVFSCIGFGLMIIATRGRKKAKETAELEARYADKPWMLRQDWAEGRIKSSATAQTILFLFMGLAFGGIGGLMTALVLPKELHKGNYAAL